VFGLGQLLRWQGVRPHHHGCRRGLIAGGPVAIAALATPFLTMFMCSNDERSLDVRTAWMCHKLGDIARTRCWASASKSTAYCCFESKLSRILRNRDAPDQQAVGQRQGRNLGFTLDNSRARPVGDGFHRGLSEFVDAAKLPDEIETSRQIRSGSRPIMTRRRANDRRGAVGPSSFPDLSVAELRS
jgi:hypothetical protein